MQFKLHTFVEVKNDENWMLLPLAKIFQDKPKVYAALFLNNRNYNALPFIDLPRGLPKDCCSLTLLKIAKLIEPHNFSWLTNKDLIKCNYNLYVVCKTPVPLKDYLGENYFNDLKNLQSLKKEYRVIIALEG